ncbi:MAG: hypothetical protein NZ992_03680 [Candidatus Korarchaeum sp.]|nr:hypothetical protein [Candidatus Korarchaeum sp.]
MSWKEGEADDTDIDGSKVSDDNITEILKLILSIKGILKIKLLNEHEKKIILELESRAEKNILMGLMPGINRGVREALSRSITLAAITDNDFEWPDRGLVKMIYNDEVLGEDIRNERELEILKKEGHKILANYIVIYKDKYEKLKEIGGFKAVTLVVAPLDLPWTKEVPRASSVVVGSPSPPADIFIKGIMNVENTENKGSILIGIDLKK